MRAAVYLAAGFGLAVTLLTAGVLVGTWVNVRRMERWIEGARR